MRTKAKFLTPEPVVQFCEDGRNCILQSLIAFRDSRNNYWYAYANTITDGASIPRILWPILGGPYEGLHRDAALLHDEAYRWAPKGESTFCSADSSLERELADEMMFEACLAKGTPYWKAFLIYHGLRLGGWYAWMQHAKSKI